MRQYRHQFKIAPPVLHRLCDDDPGAAWDGDEEVRWDASRMAEAVRQDIEALLNTRRHAGAEPGGDFREVENSIWRYGVPDLTMFHYSTANDCEQLAQLLKSVIERFEPRLSRVKIEVKTIDEPGRWLRFSIEGTLRVEPAPERLVFDSALELLSGKCQVKGGE